MNRRILEEPPPWLRGAVVVALLTSIGAAVGGLLALTSPVPYTATAYVSVSATTSSGLTREVGYAQAYGHIADSPEVLADAAARVAMTPGDLAAALDATASRDSPVIQLSATATSAKRAVELANAASAALVTYGNARSATSSVALSVFGSAPMPAAPSSLSPALVVSTGALIGVLIGGLLLLGPAPPSLLPTRTRSATQPPQQIALGRERIQ